MVSVWRNLQARRAGQTKSDVKRQHITGWEDGRQQKNGVRIPDPAHGSMFPTVRYAALAFFAAVVDGWQGFVLSLAFRVACVFSLAANSCLTLVVIAATSTL